MNAERLKPGLKFELLLTFMYPRLHDLGSTSTDN